ncbi:PQQ-binding-like beta-propeller repeat protein [Actinoplanes sp. G11-F43]|uniref:outer membrane protein assembly factor BamB family protein n=1 Tax=Actinoplanes sp. G11-F43 TaxID=3424130 RepID=UPI003D3248C8
MRRTEPDWTRTLGTDRPVLDLGMTGPYLALTFLDRHLSLVDPGSGRERWNSSGYRSALPVADRVLLTTGDGRIGLFDPVAGRVGWWQRSGARPVAVTTAGPHLQVVFGDASAAVYDRATGRRLSAVTGIPAHSPGPDGATAGRAPVTVVSGDLLLVLGDHSIVALGLPGLEQRWWTSAAREPLSARPCGTRLCVTSTDGLTVLDRETGAPLWASRQWTELNGDLATSPIGRITRVDPDSGTVLAEEHPGALTGDFRLRLTPDRTAVFDRVTGELRAVVPGALQWCTATGPNLACHSDTGAITIWRIPPRRR